MLKQTIKLHGIKSKLSYIFGRMKLNDTTFVLLVSIVKLFFLNVVNRLLASVKKHTWFALINLLTLLAF